MLSTARLSRWPVWATIWRYITYPFTRFLDICHLLLGTIAERPSPGDVEQLGGTEEELQKCASFVAATEAGESAKPEFMRTITYICVPGSWERQARPDLPPKYFEIPTPQPGEVIYVTKGNNIASGGTAFLERLPSGNVIKTPKPHPFFYNKYCYNMRLEALIYEKIGSHRSIPRTIAWDSETCCLTMEYMANGNLRDHIRQNHENITLELRHRWARQAAEGLCVVHSVGAVHCDVSPRNFLLDGDLSLKISDFGGSSLLGSIPTAVSGTRFLPPAFDEGAPPSFKDDIFSLGSTIYFIVTGRYPYEETSSDEVEKLYEANIFPDVTHLSCGAVIKQCWENQIDTAQEVHDRLEALERASIPNLL